MTESLADSAVGTDAEKKAPKTRKPKHAPEGVGETGSLEDLNKEKAEKKAKKARGPKMVQAMNEDGTPQVDAEGNPVMVEAPSTFTSAVELDRLTIAEPTEKPSSASSTDSGSGIAYGAPVTVTLATAASSTRVPAAADSVRVAPLKLSTM